MSNIENSSKSTTLGKKSDPMLEGVDLNYLDKYETMIEDMKERSLLPPNYTVHSSIQLLPERVIDTTNRSHVMEALKDGFDPDGFRNGKPLKRDLFYMNPFITCQWCNAMNYVDVVAVRRMLSLPDELKDMVRTEGLPPCHGCGRADGFEVGANDFIEQIRKRKEEEEARKQRLLVYTVKLQRMYRAHLRYLYGYAYNRKILARAKLMHRAATQIQAVARVRLCRRILKTERALLIIKHGHPKLLERSLEVRPGRKRCFWYDTQMEVNLLYADYINLASRTGFQPPRMLVEKNILELARRIRDRENELVRLVQKRWRGVMTRRIVKLYRLESDRMRQWQVAHVMKLQRLYRGFHSRLRLPDLKDCWLREELMRKYKQERADKAWVKDREWTREKARGLYRRERRDEATARQTGRIEEMKHYGGRKMQAFSDSCYADNQLQEMSTVLIDKEKVDMFEKEQKDKARRERKEFLIRRINEHGPRGYGKRGFHYSKAGTNAMPRHNDVHAFLRLSTSQPSMSTSAFASASATTAPVGTPGNDGGSAVQQSGSRGRRKKITETEEAEYKAVPGSRTRGMGKLFEKELTDIISKEVEIAQHTFSKKGLLERLRAHNASDGFRKHYRFPKDINEDPMKFLNDDVDTTIRYQDQKMKDRIRK